MQAARFITQTTFQNALSKNTSRLMTTCLGLTALALLGLAAAPAAHAQGYTLNTLASFNGINGSSPYAGLTLSGNTLYGTTVGGGANGDGTVFSLTPNGAPVPEASSVISFGLLLLGGLGGAVLRARRKSAAG